MSAMTTSNITTQELISFHDIYNSNVKLFQYLNKKYLVAADYLGLGLLIQVGMVERKINKPVRKPDLGLPESGKGYQMLNKLVEKGFLEIKSNERVKRFSLSGKGMLVLNEYFSLMRYEIKRNQLQSAAIGRN